MLRSFPLAASLLLILLPGLASFSTARADEPQPAAPPAGFQAIFSGQDLSGWEGSPDYWSVKDGCLTGVTDGSLKYNRFIIWRGGALKNFELRVKVKVTAGGNSGLNYRSQHRPDLGDGVVTGYQCDVVPGRADYNGMLYEERGRRILAHTGEKVIIDVKGQPWVVGKLDVKEFKAGQWQKNKVNSKYGPLTSIPHSDPKLGWLSGYGPWFLPINKPSGEYTTTGIHGTSPFGTLPWSCSHGCVRLSNDSVQQLHELLPKPKGTPIEILFDCEE